MTNENSIFPVAEIEKYCFLTGSQAFGTANKKSDWDYAYSILDSTKIDDILNIFSEKSRLPSNYNNGYKIIAGGNIYNMIPLYPHEFTCWYFATVSLTSVLRDMGELNPIVKYGLFESLVGVFKLSLPIMKESMDSVNAFNRKLLTKSITNNNNLDLLRRLQSEVLSNLESMQKKVRDDFGL